MVTPWNVGYPALQFQRQSTYARDAGSPCCGCGVIRPPTMSAGSHAGTEQAVAPHGSEARLMTPGVAAGPIAWSSVPLPVAEIVELEPLHAVAFESTVITPWAVAVPTVTCEPPSTLIAGHPVGSSTQSAGGLAVIVDGRTVAE